MDRRDFGPGNRCRPASLQGRFTPLALDWCTTLTANPNIKHGIATVRVVNGRNATVQMEDGQLIAWYDKSETELTICKLVCLLQDSLNSDTNLRNRDEEVFWLRLYNRNEELWRQCLCFNRDEEVFWWRLYNRNEELFWYCLWMPNLLTDSKPKSC